MSHRSPCRWLLVLLCAAVLPAAGTLSAQSRAKPVVRRTRDVSMFRRQHEDRRKKFVAAIEEIAATCEAKNLPEAAEQVRQTAEPVDTSELRLAPLPRKVQPPLASSLPPDESWRSQLRHQQQDYSKGLYLISRNALKEGHVSYAYDLIREVALHDPDHTAARRILGYVRTNDEWLSAFEARMQKEKKVWHEQFGWLPREHVERYERGDRFYQNKWMSAEKEAALRQDFVNCWEVRSEHYLVKTDHSLERGVQLSKKLEDFHDLFYHVMAGFFTDPDQVKKLMEGSRAIPAVMPRPNIVHYYRTRDEYLAAVRLETNQPVEITRGIYFPRNGIAYFFFDPTVNDDSTLYHEATHQLLSGSRPQTGEVGITGNFWIIEGIACYMESFQREGARFSVGDPRNGRIQAARAHLLREKYYVPFREFSRIGMVAYQSVKPPKLGMNYSQGAALVHFFMHYDDGRYREELIEHLSQIYSPTRSVRESPESLEDMTGVEAEELDQQYAEYIRDLGRIPGLRREPSGVGE